MTQATPTLAVLRSRTTRVATAQGVLWAAFVLVHLWLGYLNFYPYFYGLGDVTGVYKFWAEQALVANSWVGIDTEFVYPLGALVPILAAASFGLPAYASTWMILVAVVNAGAFAFLTGSRTLDGTRRFAPIAAWWWLVFLVLLGPIATGRIDAFTVPFALVGLLLAARRPVVASVLLTVATWIKVWPAVLLAAVLVASRRRAGVLYAAVLTSAVVLGVALLLGSGANVLSFITQQTGRGLQIEAPITTFWMWQAAAGVPGVGVYYDLDILTYQMTGAGVEVAAAVMTPLLVLVAAGVCVLGYLVVRRAEPGAALPVLLAPLSLALVVALIAFNKVGSPQFVLWLAVPIVLGLASERASGLSFRTPAVLALVIALLTQLIYPVYYGNIVGLDPSLLGVLTLRNLLYFVLLGWAITVLVRLVRGGKLDAGVLPARRETSEE
ncbi:uncharacterized protein DUF2029 [Glaciihabitans tibetensis]|uniref:Uncharacterized protein DUF2029 n=1 Tax=Glaciihabitans tibetensis TaxID=1266600 RepID=A0A2T0VH29_9MICO|nr:glycosyltransferase 87 family protein [Glaciihabitans tibetensis]PRY69528.1 uncharacterized protein DUF2029 [Glaciihabitans tibetensis]